jgi:hypothetical protein
MNKISRKEIIQFVRQATAYGNGRGLFEQALIAIMSYGLW